MIERLSVSIDIAELDSALRLRARAEDLAQRDLPQTIERVFDTFDVPEMRIELSRIDLDLGAISAERLEEDAPAALERALVAALSEALRQARHAASPDRRAISVAAGALEDFDTYLVHGTPRFRGEEGFDPLDAFRRLFSTQPDGLVTMLRRHGHDRHALDRLVLQLEEADLCALLELLTPAEAALILSYQVELRHRYRSVPAAIPEPALRHATWVLTLEFLLNEPGTQFNRRAYAEHLLRGIAAEQRIAYSALLHLIRDALDQTRRRRPVAGSLPGILDALIAEHESAIASTEPQRTATRVQEGDGLLLQRFKDAAGDPAALEALVRQLTTPLFAALIGRLEPAVAALILAHVTGLTALHREAPLVGFSHAGIERQLRLIVVRALLHRTGARLDRRGWLQLILRRLAAIGGVSRAFLLESLTGALIALRHRLPPGDMLPAAIAELAADLPVSVEAFSSKGIDSLALLISRLHRHRDDDVALQTIVRGMTDATFEAVVERLQPRHAGPLLEAVATLIELQRRHMLVALSLDAFELHLRLIALRRLLHDPPQRLRHAAWMAHLSQGVAIMGRIDPTRFAAWIASAGDGSALNKLRGDPATLARAIARGGAGVGDLIRGAAEDQALLMRATATMSEAGVRAALETFGAAGAAAAGDLTLLAERHAEMALVELDTATFRGLTAALAISALARRERFSRAGLHRHLLEGIARHQGLSTLEVGDWRQIERRSESLRASETSSGDPLIRAERFLRAGGPAVYAFSLAQAAAQNPERFAALLRRLTAAASGESGALVERLLAWMLPEEIVAALVPGSVGRAAAWAARLADLPGSTMTMAWVRVLDAALRGEPIDSADPPAPGERHDRRALLRHWLEHGTLAWWAPSDTRIEQLLVDFAASPLPELQQLFADAGIDEIAVRLARAIEGLGTTRGPALVKRLVPWAFATAGPFTALSADFSGDRVDAARIRAAAAALAGAPIDWHWLAQPLPVPDVAAEPKQETPPAPADRAALLEWLSGAGPEHPPRLASWLRLLAELADRGDPSLDSALRGSLMLPEARARWIAAMPEEIFARIVHRLLPERARFLLDAAAIVATAWRQLVPSVARGTAVAALRASLLAILAERGSVSAREAVDRLIGALPANASEIATRTRTLAAELARSGGYANVQSMLNQSTAGKPSPSVEARTPEPIRLPEPELGDHLYVSNAGLVLFNPFLPLFFERIGVLTQDAEGIPRVMGLEATSRAVHLLQYLVDGRCDAPEPELALNKLLSGVPLAAPVSRAIELADADRMLCDQLIGAVIANWPILKNTSAAGLRETFIQRAGRLRREADRWTLDVQRKTLDVLVDQIPWNRALVYHRWMAEPVHVNW